MEMINIANFATLIKLIVTKNASNVTNELVLCLYSTHHIISHEPVIVIIVENY